MRLRHHHALITGGGTGIGAAIAGALAAEGAKLTLIGRRREPLEETAKALSSAAFAEADVTDAEQVQAAFATARAAHGPVTILVNNAGTADTAPFAKLTRELWRSTMAVNLDALLHCCQAALPDLLAADAGRIVTIASTAALEGFAYAAAYTAAKHGALGLTRALAAELRDTRVTVNAVCPGFTDTPLLDRSVAAITDKTGRTPDAARQALAALNPTGRLVTPREVAAAVLALCLPESAAVTGQAIVVDGSEPA
ncbi:MAG TPA: SDR family NAD(P)-dependent oxidoreductase [Allosphingosinicella sp.]